MAIFRNVKIHKVEGEFKLVVQTEVKKGERTYWANTAVHDQRFTRRIGGVRLVKDKRPGESPQDLTELGELASAMTWKSPLSGIPADGEKTIIYSPDPPDSPEEELDQEELASVLAEHLSEILQADRGIIFGPDIGCDDHVMQELARQPGAGDHASGLLQGEGGLSIDGEGYTAWGLVAGIVVAARRRGWDLSQMRAVVEGFGAVGAHAARNLRQHGVTICAVNTEHGALVADPGHGLDVEELFLDWKTCYDRGRPKEAFLKFRESPPQGAKWKDLTAIWTEPAEIFIPAARTDTLAKVDELEGLRVKGTLANDVEQFFKATGVRMVVEGANHPLTDAAEAYLEEQGVFILPDYMINCGGLIGCWADWVYRRELQSGGSEGEEWRKKLKKDLPALTARIIEENVAHVFEATKDRAEGIRKATHELAQRRRDELAGEYQAFLAGGGGDPVGRIFARRLMDRQLGLSD